MIVTEIKIKLVQDKITRRKALLFEDNDGDGYRITPYKDTGSWEIIESFNCRFSDVHLKQYGKRKKI